MRNIEETVSATEVIKHFKTGSSCFFSSPKGTKLTDGIWRHLNDGGRQGCNDLPVRVNALLMEAKAQFDKAPIVIGTIPFDLEHPVNLFVPQCVMQLEHLQLGALKENRLCVNTAFEVTPVPSEDQFLLGVERALEIIRKRELTKVVLARSLHLQASGDIAINNIILNLVRNNSGDYSFAITVPNLGTKHRTLVGASPELLVSKFGNRMVANPLAGSAARSEDPEEDKRRAKALLLSGKNRHEHAVVIQAVSEALRPFCKTLHVPTEPQLIKTSTLWHLSTVMQGELNNVATTSLELGLALHPTPAVCGTPTSLARQAIFEIEPFNRDFYAGMVGWCDLEGDGEWVITLRCADIEGQSVRLFAGAGIVADSNPEEELAETSAKFRTMLSAIGIEL